MQLCPGVSLQVIPSDTTARAKSSVSSRLGGLSVHPIWFVRRAAVTTDVRVIEAKNVSRGTFLLLSSVHLYQKLIVRLKKGNVLGLKG